MDTVYSPFFIALTLHGGYGEQTSYIPPLTLGSPWPIMKILNEQVHRGMHLKKFITPTFPGFDKDTPLKTPLTTHLSTPSSLSLPLLPISQTPTPTPTFTFVSSSSITTLEPYIPPKSKTTHQLSTLASSSSITQIVLSSSSRSPTPIHYH